jgi:hypothetical protein
VWWAVVCVRRTANRLRATVGRASGAAATGPASERCAPPSQSMTVQDSRYAQLAANASIGNKAVRLLDAVTHQRSGHIAAALERLDESSRERSEHDGSLHLLAV